MSKDSKPIILNSWNMGGISESRILGENDRAMYKMVGTDVHSQVGLLKNNRALAPISTDVIDGFAKRMVACSDGNVYAFSSTSGKIWKYASGVFTLVYTANSPVGDDNIIGACEYNNYLYFATQNYLYRIQVDNTDETWSSYVEEVGHMNLDYAVGDAGYLGGSLYSANMYSALVETSTVTFTAATNKVNLTGHGFINTDKVVFESTGTLPAIITAGTAYYVVNKGADDFEISLTSGGAALDIADTGTGVHTVLGNASSAFTPQSKTMIGVTLNIKTKPSTSLIVTLHNASNASVATKTIANADLAVGDNELYFASTVTNEKDEPIHAHVYQTGTGGVLGVAVADEFADMYLEVFGQSNSSFHPMVVLNGILFIGDNNYVHQVENYLVLNALDLPVNTKITALSKVGTDLLIGTEVASTVHSAMIYRWNTWSVSWSIEDEIEEVSINAFIPVDNYVYVVAGKRGNVYFYNGEKLELFRRIGGEFGASDAIKVYPDAVASLHGIPLIGVSNSSGNPIEEGVYAMGTENPRLFPRIFDLEYVLSAGLTGVEIGSICVNGDYLFISWRKTVGATVTYGIDGFSGTSLYPATYIQTRVLYKDRNFRTVYRKAFINYMSIPTNTARAVQFEANLNQVLLNAHGYENGARVNITVATGGTLSSNLVAGQDYYVINKTTNNFQISLTEGGTAVGLSDAGTGVHSVALADMVRLYYRKDYATSWTELTLIHDTDKKQFITQDFGDYAFCIEFKLVLNAVSTTSPIIDEITLADQSYGI